MRKTRIALTSFVASLLAVPTVSAANTPWAHTREQVFYRATMETRDGTQQGLGPLPCRRTVPEEAVGREWAWEIVTYLSSRGTIVALGGETVKVEIVGINGDVHPAAIPGLVDSFTVRRGHVTRVIFTAIRPDPHPIICTKHTPHIRGALVVLPE